MDTQAYRRAPSRGVCFRGSAAAPDTSTPDTAAPALVATAVPEAMAEPAAEMMAEGQVSPGRVTLMLGGFNAEVFDNTVGGLAKEPRKHIHGNLTSWDLIDGQMQIVPGIAKKWEMANGGKTLIYTIMEGGKFHDGSDIEPESL